MLTTLLFGHTVRPVKTVSYQFSEFSGSHGSHVDLLIESIKCHREKYSFKFSGSEYSGNIETSATEHEMVFWLPSIKSSSQKPILHFWALICKFPKYSEPQQVLVTSFQIEISVLYKNSFTAPLFLKPSWNLRSTKYRVDSLVILYIN